MEKEFIDPRQLGSKFRSKDELYKRMTIDRKSHNIISNTVGFLPTFKRCPIRFLKQILSGKKKVGKSYLAKLKLTASLCRLSE